MTEDLEALQALNARLSAYRDGLHIEDREVYAGGQLIATLNCRGSLRDDLAQLLVLAPQLLEMYLSARQSAWWEEADDYVGKD